jgi:putative membrane protein
MVPAHSVRRLSRLLVGTSAVVLAFLLAPVSPAQAAGDVPVPTTSLSNKGVGAVSDADKDFVVKVRLAGLWEIPAGNMTATKSNNPNVKKIGASIAAQHVVLDDLDRAAAKKLGIMLPNEPNSNQAYWLSEMENAATPEQFDQIFIDRLRAAHGNIFPAIATIRASTRNDSVRKLAQEANQFVMTHMTLLESSNIVDYGSLPTAPAPAAANGPVPVDGQMLASARSNEGIPGVSTTVVLLVLAAALVAGVITTMRIFRAR